MSLLKCVVNRSINKKVKVLSTLILNCDKNYATSSGILNSGIPDLNIPRISLDEYVFENIGKWENHTAVVSLHIILLYLFYVCL